MAKTVVPEEKSERNYPKKRKVGNLTKDKYLVKKLQYIVDRMDNIDISEIEDEIENVISKLEKKRPTKIF